MSVPLAERKTDYKDPPRFSHEADFQSLVREMMAHDGSDLYLQADRPALASINGQLKALSNKKFDTNEIATILRWVTGKDNAFAKIQGAQPINAAYELFDLTERDHRGERLRHRFRVNATPVLAGGAVAAQVVMRAIPYEPPTAAKLNLPPELVRAATPKNGIVYVCGATGSGKSTTFSAIVREVLEGDTPVKGNLVTYEEPIEFVYEMVSSRHSVIVQSEVPTHVVSFADGIREAMRRKPALILIGEARDEETISAAVEASLTGHTVYTTVHAINVAAVVRRLVSRYPRELQHTAMFDVVETARYIVAQRLVPTLAGRLTAARETLEFDDDVRDELLRLDDMARVTARVRDMVDERGWSFVKEGKRLFETGQISAATARELGYLVPV
ncbi:ATPase, T2SS/T4P/T4SS family [Parachitinimonas caeni]|uniref:ATPase, T2SS/T4P/T4SS family n=1 Tax=Parachitinimonas caeni TaxID=3031301 RepID=A0ABT7DXH0_9NEIS|nr:ATPase, T2SS/T4P/T4SS family [Parachitinimonas caeni]MDK2123865.1 ATPase, T2SS/T4P/T4SS family [Parachitinimonas caeni]